MIKKVVLPLLLAICVGLQAQTLMIYARFDAAYGASSALVQYLDKNCHFDEPDIHIAIYYSNGADPIICHNAREWKELRTIILDQQTNADFDAALDFEKINDELSTLLGEKVLMSSTDITIEGSRDMDADFVVLMPHRMYEDVDATDMIARMISVNKLRQRGVNVRLMTYSDNGTATYYGKLKSKKTYNYPTR